MVFFSPLEQFDALVLFVCSLGYFDISFTNILLPLLISNIFLGFIIYFYSGSMRLVPEYWQLLLESLYKFVLDILEQQVGSRGLVYFPFIFSLFFFIFLCNFISMTPFGVALTSHIVMIIFTSLSLGLSIFIIGLYLHNLEFLKIFVPECPLVLLPFLMIIEIFSYVIRSFSLAIRLSANIMAGHTLVYIISSFILNVTYLKF